MTQPNEIPFVQPRRRDRAIEDRTWIRDLLTRSPVGNLATVGPDGPSINPNLFVLDPEADVIYLHTARRGRTRTNVESRNSVAFCVSEMGRLLPAESAMEFSAEFSSVILEGTSRVIEDPTEASRALDLLMHKYAPHLEPGRDYRGVSSSDLSKTTVFRVDVERWTGKGKTSDASDAYEYSTSRSCPWPARRPSS